jgi:hypothetical protein
VDHLRKSIQSGLYYLCSIDLVGATAYKSANHDTEWHTDFENFYNKSFEVFSFHCNTVKLWKRNGDEVLFFIKVESLDQIFDIYTAFSKTAIEIKIYVEETFLQKMGIKLTSWLVGAPVINRVLCAPESALIPEEDLLNEKVRNATNERILYESIDFIGPSVDTGFRLCAHSRQNMHVLSIELAYILASHAVKHSADGVNLYYQQDVGLKGVLGGIGYPLVYSIISDALMVAKLDAMGVSPTKLVLLKHCAEMFIRKFDENVICLPYIADPSNSESIPQSHQKKWQDYNSRFERSTKLDISHNPPTEPESPAIPQSEIQFQEDELTQKPKLLD